MSIGLTVPLAKSTGSIGYFEVTNSELAAVENNLRSLLITNWGERVMHYNFGCNLIEFVFEQSEDRELKEKITGRIISQIAKWMPFVSVDNLEIILGDDDSSLPPNGMAIRIEFRLNHRPDQSALFDFVFTP